jgi:hypothetical protein
MCLVTSNYSQNRGVAIFFEEILIISGFLDDFWGSI